MCSRRYFFLAKYKMYFALKILNKFVELCHERPTTFQLLISSKTTKFSTLEFWHHKKSLYQLTNTYQIILHFKRTSNLPAKKHHRKLGVQENIFDYTDLKTFLQVIHTNLWTNLTTKALRTFKTMDLSRTFWSNQKEEIALTK